MEVLNFCAEHPFIMFTIMLFAYGCLECIMINIAKMVNKEKINDKQESQE